MRGKKNFCFGGPQSHAAASPVSLSSCRWTPTPLAWTAAVVLALLSRRSGTCRLDSWILWYNTKFSQSRTRTTVFTWCPSLDCLQNKRFTEDAAEWHWVPPQHHLISLHVGKPVTGWAKNSCLILNLKKKRKKENDNTPTLRCFIMGTGCVTLYLKTNLEILDKYTMLLIHFVLFKEASF